MAIRSCWSYPERVSSEPYSVSVVLDRDYGLRLCELLRLGSVWAVESPTNRNIAQEIWRENPSRSHLDGLTIFSATEGSTSEQILIDELENVDLHHGHYSADPPYTILRVIGAQLTDEVRGMLSELGFDAFETTDGGFEATRPLSAAIA